MSTPTPSSQTPPPSAKLSDEEYATAQQEEVASDLQSEAWHSQPLTIFVFGASGDLAKKKTYPALIDLFKADSLSKRTLIVGTARSDKGDVDFRSHLRPFLEKQLGTKDASNAGVIDRFLARCIYRAAQYGDAEALKKISAEVVGLHAAEGKVTVENRLFYLALPPSAFVSSARGVKDGALSSTGFNRVVVEKPFGRDTESAAKLGRDLGEIFDESFLYRIDHYLGKELVQNMVVLRFGNTFLEPIWNHKYVKSVVISFKEDIGTMGRGGYFDQSGIIRDVMQNHLMQVLSIIAMEPPVRVAGEGYSDFVRDEKVKVLNCIKPITLDNVVLGQYVSNGTEPGYKDDDTVPKASKTPTSCCAVMYVDNARWDGVPFIMKAGKALDDRRAEVRIQLRSPSGAAAMFDGEDVPLNELVIRLQPKEAIYMKTNVKKPGLHTVPAQSELDLSYDKRYSDVAIYDAYTRLVLDVLRGKQATFVRNDELMAAWKIFTPLLDEIEKGDVDVKEYKFGTRGPPEADEMIKKAGYERHQAYGDEWRRKKNAGAL